MQNFLSNANTNNDLSNENSLLCLFKYFNKLNNLIFSMFSKDKNNYLKEKLVFSLFKKDSDYDSESTENQINEQANNPIHSFNERKNKEQTKVVFSITQENDFSNQYAKEKNQVLNFQPITGSQLIKHTQNMKLERMVLPRRVKKRKSRHKGQKKP
jgi:hypothetical protein